MVMAFNEQLARSVALQYCNDQGDEKGLVASFVQVCAFLHDNPDRLSWRSRGNIPSVQTPEGLYMLAEKYYSAYRRSDFPAMAGTFPDEIVSIVMMEAFGYSRAEVDRIKIEHQKAMVAENCVGALLERYLDSVLRPSGWHWCCGSFVKAIDFIRRDSNGNWLALQIKNRDNSENSSSSSIRAGTTIEKWFRSFSKRDKQNWDKLPPLMQGFALSEEGFVDYVRSYLSSKKSVDDIRAR
jgi:hypothetical protein